VLLSALISLTKRAENVTRAWYGTLTTITGLS
jgi:hypothetical protein